MEKEQVEYIRELSVYPPVNGYLEGDSLLEAVWMERMPFCIRSVDVRRHLRNIDRRRNVDGMQRYYSAMSRTTPFVPSMIYSSSFYYPWRSCKIVARTQPRFAFSRTAWRHS